MEGGGSSGGSGSGSVSGSVSGSGRRQKINTNLSLSEFPQLAFLAQVGGRGQGRGVGVVSWFMAHARLQSEHTVTVAWDFFVLKYCVMM